MLYGVCKMKIEKNVKNNDNLRKAYNELSMHIFGINFEDWYQAGFWGDKHIPYSIMGENGMIANVSVNILDILWNGENKQYIQLGNVMTHENYRNQGYIRILIEEIFKDYEKRCDGIFLFANDSVLDFYPKFGFNEQKEYRYYKITDINGDSSLKKINIKNTEYRTKFVEAIKNSIVFSKLDTTQNYELIMFYANGFMSDDIYYDEENDIYVIVEQNKEEAFIHAIFSKHDIPIENIVKHFSGHISKIILGFVPNHQEEYEVEINKEENTTLFIRNFDFAGEKWMFPTLAHS